MAFSASPNRSYPYDAVVYVSAELADGSYISGSGAMIAPNEVLTAAHVVDQAVAVTVYAGRSGFDEPYGADQASSWTYDPGFANSVGSDTLSAQQSQYDFGLIRLNDNLGSRTGYFGVQSDYGGGTVNLTGYPAIDGTTQETETVPVQTSPFASVLSYRNGTVYPGNSGGPLWGNGSTGPYIYGVVSTSLNAARIDDAAYSFIENDAATHGGLKAVTPNPVTPVPINPQTVGATDPVFRFYDSADGGHFFTTSTTEKAQVLANRPDLTYEGVGFQAVDSANSDASASSVYRFYDPTDGGHFVTISLPERNQVIATRPDLRYEGPAFLEYSTPVAGSTPVYRFYDVADGGHFFTASLAEKQQVIATRPDLSYEGVGFYSPT